MLNHAYSIFVVTENGSFFDRLASSMKYREHMIPGKSSLWCQCTCILMTVMLHLITEWHDDLQQVGLQQSDNGEMLVSHERTMRKGKWELYSVLLLTCCPTICCPAILTTPIMGSPNLYWIHLILTSCWFCSFNSHQHVISILLETRLSKYGKAGLFQQFRHHRRKNKWI